MTTGTAMPTLSPSAAESLPDAMRPASPESDLSSVTALCPHGGDRPARAARTACAPGHHLAGTGGPGHGQLGGGPSNLADVREDAYEAERAAQLERRHDMRHDMERGWSDMEGCA